MIWAENRQSSSGAESVGRGWSDRVGSTRLEGMPGGTRPEPPTPLFQLERAESVGGEREAETFQEPVLPNSR